MLMYLNYLNQYLQLIIENYIIHNNINIKIVIFIIQ